MKPFNHELTTAIKYMRGELPTHEQINFAKRLRTDECQETVIRYLETMMESLSITLDDDTETITEVIRNEQMITLDEMMKGYNNALYEHEHKIEVDIAFVEGQIMPTEEEVYAMEQFYNDSHTNGNAPGFFDNNFLPN
jgi:hypothetical protein